MAVLAVRPEMETVGSVLSPDPVTVDAQIRRPRDLPVPMAFRAADVEMTPLEGKQSALVEGARGVLEVEVGGVARGALNPKGALVRVRMARRAIRVVVEERPGGVTLRAVAAEISVKSVQDKTGLGAVVKGLTVEGQHLCVPATVLGVADRAVVYRDLGVEPPLRLHPRRDGVVTDQTALALDLVVVVVTVIAAVGIVEARMSLAEQTRRVIRLLRPGPTDGNHERRQPDVGERSLIET